MLACLQKIEKDGVFRKAEAFDRFFEGAGREAAESMDHYLRRKQQAWDDLKDLDDQTSMSDDLLTYFLLKGSQVVASPVKIAVVSFLQTRTPLTRREWSRPCV